MTRKETVVEIEGRKLALSNLDKVLYPEVGFTKRQVIDYYVRIAPFILPHLSGRALTLKRYPNGVSGMFFYEKNCPKHRPEWMTTAPVWSAGNRRWMEYCVVQDLPSLVWAANLAALELHTSLSMASAVEHPSFLVFDLDPGEPADIVQCCQVALWVRDNLQRMGLRCFAKTSGSKGLQVYAPLNSGAGYQETKPLAHQLALALERRHPELVVSDMKKSLRGGKVLVDWSQNDGHKTTACVYSLRARTQPTVSTPVSWSEVSRCLESADATQLSFTASQVLERVERQGDLFAPVLRLCQQLPATVEAKPRKRRASAAVSHVAEQPAAQLNAAEAAIQRPKRRSVQATALRDEPSTAVRRRRNGQATVQRTEKSA